MLILPYELLDEEAVKELLGFIELLDNGLPLESTLLQEVTLLPLEIFGEELAQRIADDELLEVLGIPGSFQ